MIYYIKGDATNPKIEGPKIICHVCNDIGKWGKGFVMALSKKWFEPEKMYHTWYNNRSDHFGTFQLGETQYILVEKELWVANMIAQHGIYKDSNGIPPIRYNSLRSCLKQVNEFATYHKASIHMPKIGCGLAGGDWLEVKEIILQELTTVVCVYELN